MIITEDTAIDVFIASKIGSFKHLKYHTEPSKNNKRCIENLVDIKTLEKDDSITSMVWADDEQIEIMLGRKNQQIQIYNTQKDAFTRTYKADFGAGHIVGLGRYERKIIAGLASGVVRIWSKKSEVKIETGAKMDRLRQCPDDAALFATGGEENDLKIWRIGEEAATFSAKNLPNDWLQLRRPVWVSDLTFLPGSGGCLAAVCSRHGYVRLYDSRAQRRPVSNVDFENMAATCIAPSFDERQVLVGFGRGQLHQVDLRQNRRDKGYKGAVGAVTDVVAVATNNRRLVVSAGLDRTLRIHEWESKSLVYKQYLTSKLACVLVQTKNATPLRNPPEQEFKSEDELKEESVVEVDDMDELFDNMETVGEKLKKKLPPPADSAKRVKPSTDGSTVEVDEDEAIAQLLRSTERQKKIREKRRKEKKAKSVFHNA